MPKGEPLYSKLPRCGFSKYAGGKPCKNPAGMRTKHLGEGPCYIHEGKPGDLNGTAGRPMAVQPVVTKKTPTGVEFDATLCGAKKTNGEGTCTQLAGHGTDHPGYGRCTNHGGSTEAGKISAAKHAIQERINTRRMADGKKVEVAPGVVMMEEISRSAGAVAYFDEIVNQIPPKEIGDIKNQTLVNMWNEQRRLLIQASSITVRAGLAERAVRIQEEQSTAVVQALMAVLRASELGLSLEQQSTARVLMARQLRALAAPPPLPVGDVINV